MHWEMYVEELYSRLWQLQREGNWLTDCSTARQIGSWIMTIFQLSYSVILH